MENWTCKQKECSTFTKIECKNVLHCIQKEYVYASTFKYTRYDIPYKRASSAGSISVNEIVMRVKRAEKTNGNKIWIKCNDIDDEPVHAMRCKDPISWSDWDIWHGYFAGIKRPQAVGTHRIIEGWNVHVPNRRREAIQCTHDQCKLNVINAELF